MIDLHKLGWDAFFESQLTDAERQSSTIARIVEPLRGLSKAACKFGEIWAEHTEKSASGAKTREAVPATGDWVVGSVRDFGAGEKRLTISRVLTRKNKLSRAAPGGKGYEQILCTNVDTAMLVLAVNQDLNLPGVKRYLEILSECEVQPVIVVSKADNEVDTESVVHAIREAAPGVIQHTLSVRDHRGLDEVESYFTGNKTVVLLGASGAGKSTLVNYLLESESQRIGEVRESDQKGRHTTTGRKLYTLPTGGMVIDSPGIREIQKWEGGSEPTEPINKKKQSRNQKHARGRKYTADDDDSDD